MCVALWSSLGVCGGVCLTSPTACRGRGDALDTPILPQDWVFRMLSLQNNYTIKNKRSACPGRSPREGILGRENRSGKKIDAVDWGGHL